MQYFVAFGLSLCLLLLSLNSVHSIQCYSCKQSVDRDCASGNPLKLDKFKVDCDLEAGATHGFRYNRCAKTLSSGLVGRSCYYNRPGFDNTCRSGNGAVGCICTGDLCNAGVVSA